MIPLKYKLNHKSVDFMYNNCIGPTMRLVTGAMALSKSSKLYDETSWLKRCENSMLNLMFKIQNGSALQCLENLVPGEYKQYMSYNL